MAPGKKEASQMAMQKRAAKYKENYLPVFKESYKGSDEDFKMNYAKFIAEHEGEELMSDEQLKKQFSKVNSSKEQSPGKILKESIVKPMLSKPFDALANNTTLGLIFFALLVGLACLSLGPKAAAVTSFFEAMNEVMITITMWFMKISPLAIACLIAEMVGSMGWAVVQAVAWYSATVLVAIFLHVIFLNVFVAIFGGKNPIDFLKGIRPAWLVAFSTASSAATLPVTMRCVTENLKVDKKVANFTLPLGATVNMDGTALYEGVAIIFLIQMFGDMPDVGIALNAGNVLLIFITAVVASVGAAAVPSAGLITMGLVALSVGLPLHYLAVVFAIDRVLDMFRTSTNVMGDSAVAVVVDRSASPE
jgi:proton glutamate symport protein